MRDSKKIRPQREFNFRSCIKYLHKSTTYAVKWQEGDSDRWNPERGLREGCPNYSTLFNIYHQLAMRAAKKRKEQAALHGLQVGIKWHWLTGNRIPPNDKFGKPNSGATEEKFSLSLFVDDRTFLGTSEEIEQGTSAIKRVTNRFENKNDAKEELLKFGNSDSRSIRMLGNWMTPQRMLITD